nr:zinc finger, CCHC-type [Tanacetum cinerariifolium]
MGDENSHRTLGDYSRPSHEGCQNTIELPERNSVLPLRFNTTELVQNGCAFHGLQKPKRVKDSAYHKEKMLLCKQAEQGVPLQEEHYDWLEDMDEEVDEQELEAHYSYMAKIQE